MLSVLLSALAEKACNSRTNGSRTAPERHKSPQIRKPGMAAWAELEQEADVHTADRGPPMCCRCTSCIRLFLQGLLRFIVPHLSCLVVQDLREHVLTRVARQGDCPTSVILHVTCTCTQCVVLSSFWSRSPRHTEHTCTSFPRPDERLGPHCNGKVQPLLPVQSRLAVALPCMK